MFFSPPPNEEEEKQNGRDGVQCSEEMNLFFRVHIIVYCFNNNKQARQEEET